MSLRPGPLGAGRESSRPSSRSQNADFDNRGQGYVSGKLEEAQESMGSVEAASSSQHRNGMCRLSRKTITTTPTSIC
jgi:hypothetical protein